ncbi:hypothetical protein BS78_02G162500 [Paspalum vaginatum]|nr:hypothetical protein BS78_02G162500 [Paspalum vaginatum]
MAAPRRGEAQGVGGDPAPALRPPAHVMARVFSQLDCVDVLSCSLVCKQWYRDSAELREEWRKEYLDAWNQFGLSAPREPQPLCPNCATRSLRSLCP